jgi:hypothetical protein
MALVQMHQTAVRGEMSVEEFKAWAADVLAQAEALKGIIALRLKVEATAGTVHYFCDRSQVEDVQQTIREANQA